jgi:hypothetical protein
VVTLPNVGLQLLDVVTLTDARAGVSGEAYRVRGILETYDTTKKPLVFEQPMDAGVRPSVGALPDRWWDCRRARNAV